MKPGNYNLSIQYDKEMADQAKAKIRQTKKAALEAAAAERVDEDQIIEKMDKDKKQALEIANEGPKASVMSGAKF